MHIHVIAKKHANNHGGTGPFSDPIATPLFGEVSLFFEHGA